MATPLEVLILEDRPADAELMAHELRRAGFEPNWERVETEQEYLAHLDPALDLILADYTLPQFDASHALRLVQERGLDIPLIVVTGSISEEVAVECMKQGAADYLIKDRLARLGPAVTQALAQKALRDVQRQADARIRHLNELLGGIWSVNQLITRERNPERLLAGTCDRLVQTRGYRLVWIGQVTPGETRVLPVAHAGDTTDYLNEIQVTCDERPTGQGPTGTALRTRRPATIQDIATDARFAPWRGAALARGYASAAATPLLHGGELYGALTVYADRPRAFGAEELDLLSEVADDLALALRSIADQAERSRAEEALRQRSEQLQRLASELTLAEQRERRRMAAVLHDDLQQILVGARLRLAELHRLPQGAVSQTALEVEDLINQSLEISRSLTRELCPPFLRDGSLVPALEWLARWMREKHGLIVELTASDPVLLDSEEARVLLFQAVRELLFNVVKHAQVVTAAVQIHRLGDQIRILVRDEGIGFDPAQLHGAGGFGLFSIRERLELLGGRLEIDSAPGTGSRFALLAPRKL